MDHAQGAKVSLTKGRETYFLKALERIKDQQTRKGPRLNFFIIDQSNNF